MKRTNIAVVCAAVLLAFLTAGTAGAQSGGVYDLTWNRVATGGVTISAGGPYTLGGTFGQHEAGASSGGVYTLSGGFWAGVAAGQLVAVPDPPPSPVARHELSLSGLVGNPARSSRLTVAFSLASAEAAQLELLDVTGRRIGAFAVGSFGPGPHRFDLASGAALAPGLYWLRLTQAGRTLVRKAVVLE